MKEHGEEGEKEVAGVCEEEEEKIVECKEKEREREQISVVIEETIVRCHSKKSKMASVERSHKREHNIIT